MKTTPSLQLEVFGSQNRNHAEPITIWRARNFIHEHSDEELSLTQVARAVHISPNHLSEKFKRVTGVNFVRYVARTRYEKARCLLHDLDLRVSEVAFAVGFQSLSQFNRVFKKLSGTSPTAYRAATCARTAAQSMRTPHVDAQYRSSGRPGRDYDKGHTLRV